MRSKKRLWLVGLFAVAGALAWGGVAAYRSIPATKVPRPILGVVRVTESHIASERNGRLALIPVTVGQRVKKGDVLAVLSNPELAASAQDAAAAEDQARADRDNVEAGIRKEQVDISVQAVAIAEANLKLAQQQFNRSQQLASEDFATAQKLDEDTSALHKAQSSLDLARATAAENHAGPTKEERAIAATKVLLAAAGTSDAQAALSKTRLVAPMDAVVSQIFETPGEVVSPGQTVLALQEKHEGPWISLSIREDRLGELAIGAKVRAVLADGRAMAGRVTELRPLGEFATWRAARAVGDHDLNSFILRIDPLDSPEDLHPGMSVWVEPLRIAEPRTGAQ